MLTYPRPCDACGGKPVERKPETWHHLIGEKPGFDGDMTVCDPPKLLEECRLVLCEKCFCNALLFAAKMSMSDPKTWQALDWPK
jgi:hypothetical protein